MKPFSLPSIPQGTTGEQERETDIHSEYARQREHLERSVASLRKKLAKDTEIHRADYIRVMQVRITVTIRKYPLPTPTVTVMCFAMWHAITSHNFLRPLHQISPTGQCCFT